MRSAKKEILAKGIDQLRTFAQEYRSHSKTYLQAFRSAC
jgi:hypothetical protein